MRRLRVDGRDLRPQGFAFELHSRAAHSSGISNNTAEGSGTSRVALKRTRSTSIVVGASVVTSISLTSRSSGSKAKNTFTIPLSVGSS